jgi:HD superfamily phosphohydrolase
MVFGITEEKVFKDPVHKYIYVQDQIIWDLINTKEFQRLRRIRQLGTSYFTFHGSEHSRFSHSLGVYEITRKIISLFERNQFSDWPKEQRLLSLCAALLHDVGHGPFSHSFEHIFHTDHEQWSCRIILEDSEVNQVLSRVHPNFPREVADVICKTHPDQMVVGLISSQMDADRMDYLLRDAYFTGVHYGTFDLERILRVLRPHQGKIVVKESGMHAVEDYLMSRYQMHWQVYFHPVTRSGEILLRKIFLRARHLYADGYRYRYQVLPYPMQSMFEQKLSLEEYLYLDEAVIQTMIKQWAYENDPVLSDLCQRFEGRRLFKYISIDEQNRGQIDNVRNSFKEAGLDPEYYTEVDFQSDLPYDIYIPGQEKKQPIFLLNHRERLIEISQQSAIIQSISGIQKGEHFLYYPHDFIQVEAPPFAAIRRQLHELMKMD